MSENNSLVLFKDEPENKNLKFAHSIMVDWIYEAIVNSPRPYRLAITRSLGAGKTTIINAVRKKLEEKNSYLVSSIDVWKLDKESSRRSTLIRLAEDLGINPKEIEELKETLYGSTSDISKAKSHKTFIDKTSLGVWLFVSFIFAVIAYFLLGLASGNTELTFRFGVAFFTLLLSLSLKLIDRTFISVQRTFNRAPLVGAEEFEQSLRKIIDSKKLSSKKILIIFDNIDRATFDKTEEILTGISAFFDHQKNINKNLVILVPFAIGSQKGLTTETIQKFFDSVIPVPELVPEDLTDYTKSLLDAASWKHESNYLAELITFGPYYTPRELKHFINRLLATYDLAARMENNMSDNNEPYLIKGTITGHPLVMAKIMICEDIKPGILTLAVKRHISVTDLFDWSKLKSQVKEIEKNEELSSFLIATTGLPKKLPISLDPFLYFKGADALINISGAQEIAKSLTEGKADAIKDFLGINEDSSHRDLSTILQITLKKYKGNDQRIKNTVFVIMKSYEEVIPSSIRLQLASVLREKKNILQECDLYDLLKITPEENEDIENVDLWEVIDSLYKERFSDDVSVEVNYNWMISYLDIVLRQAKGIERSQLTPELMKSEFFFDLKIIDSMGDRYPMGFVSKEHLVNTFEKIVANNFYKEKDVDLDNLSGFIKAGVASVDANIKTDISKFFQDLWTFISGQINTPQFDSQTFKTLIAAIEGIPNDKKVDAKCWAQLTNNLNSSHTVFNNKFKAGLKAEVIALIVSINRKVKVNGLGNLKDTFTSTFVPQIDLNVIKQMASLYEDWQWSKDIDEIASSQFLQVLKKDDIAKYILKNSYGSMATIYLNNFNNFKDAPSVLEEFDNLKDESDSTVSKKDIIEKVLETPSIMTPELRDKTFQYKSQLNLKEDDFKELISFEAKNNDDIQRAKELIKVINDSFSKARVDEFEKESKDLLTSFEGGAFSAKECSQFLIATSSFDSCTDTYLRELFDIAIQKGVMDCADTNSVTEVYRRIVEVFNKNRLIDKDIFGRMEKALRNSKGLSSEKQSDLGDNLKKLKKKHFGLLGRKDNSENDEE